MTNHEGLRAAMGVRDPSGVDEIERMVKSAEARAEAAAKDAAGLAAALATLECELPGMRFKWWSIGAGSVCLVAVVCEIVSYLYG